jgi:hypothetical protein
MEYRIGDKVSIVSNLDLSSFIDSGMREHVKRLFGEVVTIDGIVADGYKKTYRLKELDGVVFYQDEC